MAEGVIDLAQGKFKRYAGATGLHASSTLSGGATTINDQTAEAARKPWRTIFARNSDA